MYTAVRRFPHAFTDDMRTFEDLSDFSESFGDFAPIGIGASARPECGGLCFPTLSAMKPERMGHPAVEASAQRRKHRHRWNAALFINW